MVKKIRIVLACISMLLITLLFLDFTGTLHHWLGWMAKIQFLPAVLALNVGVIIALIAITLIFGRIYCSVICPLGILQDMLARLNRKRNRYHFRTEKKWLRYGVWTLFIILLIAGVHSAVALLAPYSSYGRIAQNILQPIYIGINNLLALISEHFDSYAFYSREVWLRSLPTFIIAILTLILLTVLAIEGGRTYCNTICPVGTTLSFFARFSLLRMQFTPDKCKHCGKCTRNCKAACIDHKNMYIDYSRCVLCGECESQCPFDAMHYRPIALHKQHPQSSHSTPKPSHANTTSAEQIDHGRRAFMIGSGLALAGVATAQATHSVDGGLAVLTEKKSPKRHTPLTPPGALSIKNMQQRCTGCQLCVSECPNDVLRPSTDLLTLMQPTMDYARGYCRPECTRCSSVCPTGAIRPIQADLKSSIQIGRAKWLMANCLPAADGTHCGNCARHCPTGAITMVRQSPNDPTSHKIPAINEEKCIGCGSCEYHCPARPFPAIYVEGNEVHHTL